MSNTTKLKFRKRLKFYIFAVALIILLFLTGSAIYIPSPSRVILIGLDAADWEILNPLIDAGRLPNIRRLIENGTAGKLETFEISSSPVVWTTIATGVTRKTHGILGFQLPGKPHEPFTSNMRKVPALWNILSRYDKKVGIVGHWVSWPAEEINGEMVSSYISYDPVEGQRLFYKGKLRKALDLPGQTYPAELIEELEPLVVTAEMVTHEDIDQFVDIDDWDDPDLYRMADGSDSEIKESLEYIMPWTYAADKTHVDVFNYLKREKGPYDLIFTYIEGTDVTGHRFWHFHDTTYLAGTMKYWGYDMSLKDKYIKCFHDTINKYYEWSDNVIGEIMDDMGPLDTLIVLSDHGFGRFYDVERHGSSFVRNPGVGYTTITQRHTFSGTHGHFGAIMFYGANVKKGYWLEGPPPNLTDVLPTILTLMKVPVAKWIQGNPIHQAFTDRFNWTYRTKWVNAYGIEDLFMGDAEGPKSPLNPEFIRKMKSLGYLN